MNQPTNECETVTKQPAEPSTVDSPCEEQENAADFTHGEKALAEADWRPLIACLDGGRFVIIRPDRPNEWHTPNGQLASLFTLESGDTLLGGGQEHNVLAVAPFRNDEPRNRIPKPR